MMFDYGGMASIIVAKYNKFAKTLGISQIDHHKDLQEYLEKSIDQKFLNRCMGSDFGQGILMGRITEMCAQERNENGEDADEDEE